MKCQGLFGWLFGHDFVGYYDEVPTLTNLKGQDVDQAWMEDIIKASMKRTFRFAVCRRCGAIAREQEPK